MSGISQNRTGANVMRLQRIALPTELIYQRARNIGIEPIRHEIWSLIGYLSLFRIKKVDLPRFEPGTEGCKPTVFAN